MILQEEEKHNTGDLSSNIVPQVEMPASQPARLDSLPACQLPPGGTQEAYQSFLDMVSEASEGEPYYDWRVFTERELRNLHTERSDPAPLLLTRGAHIHPPTLPPQNCHIDWLSFTSEESTEILEELTRILIPTVKILPMKFGQAGYKFAKEINLSGQSIGRIAYGSTHGRNLLTLTGKGTAEVNWATFLQYYQILTQPRISRIDIAHDFFEGEINHDLVIAGYNAGKFKPIKSSKNPSINIISGTDGEGNNKGRTVTIGNKKSGKFIRCYEKGLERFAKIFADIPEDEKPPAEKMTCEDVAEGMGESSLLNWYRLEVQYGNNDRELPTDMIINRDLYFTGAYPFCEEALKMNNGKTPPRIPNNLETDIELMFKHMSDQYGSFITTMLFMGWTPEQIIQKVANGKQSQRIIKAGALDKITPYDPSKAFPTS